MLTPAQIQDYSKQLKINQSVVGKEYIQVLFLKELYQENFAKNIFFKGGTAIRLVFGGIRFSEDLDFTVEAKEKDFEEFILLFFKKLERRYGFVFKKRKTVAGKKYLLTANTLPVKGGVFISLDFSFREPVLKPGKSVLTTLYPVVFTSFVYHLLAEEVVAEKIRALLTRKKGRDIYDLWFLLSRNVQINDNLVREKLKYYQIKSYSPNSLLDKIESLTKQQFVIDIRPFVPMSEREKLDGLYEYVVAFFSQKLKKKKQGAKEKQLNSYQHK